MRLLNAERVESYRADLVLREKTFYMPDGRTHREPIAFAPGAIATQFASEGVIDAIRDVQAGCIRYREFLARIMAAGTTEYTVFLTGKRAIYTGRQGDFHVEEFPRPAAQ